MRAGTKHCNGWCHVPVGMTALMLLMGLPAAAQVEPGVTVSIVRTEPVSEPVVAGANITYSIGYSFSTGTYRNVDIVVDLPVAMMYRISSFPNGTTFERSCVEIGSPVAPPGTEEYYSSWKYRCTFSLASLELPADGLSGEILLTVLSKQYGIPDGTSLSARAELSGEYWKALEGAYGLLTNQADEESILFTADANGQVGIYDYSHYTPYVNPVWEQRDVDNDGTFKPGLSFNYPFTGYNNGTAQVDPGSTFAVTIPSFVHYLEFVKVIDFYNEPWDVAVNGSTITLTDGYPIGYMYGTDQLYASAVNQTSYLGIRVWVDCDDMGPLSGWDDDDYDATVTFNGNEPTTEGLQALGPITKTLPVSYDLVRDACGMGATGVKTEISYNSRASGRFGGWSITFTPPRGVFNLGDPIIVDYLPPNTTICDTSQPAEFTAYYCSVPEAPYNFSRSDFIDSYRANRCSTTITNPQDVTHVVWEAASWGTASTISAISFGITHFNDEGLTDGWLIQNEASLSTADIAGVENSGLSVSATAQYTISNSPSLSVWSEYRWLSNGTSVSDPLIAAGQSVWFAGQAAPPPWGSLPINPTIDVIIPAQFEVLEAPQLEFLCAAPTSEQMSGPTMFVDVDGRTIYRWITSGGWSIPGYCYAGCYPDAYYSVVTARAHLRLREDVFVLDGLALISTIRFSAPGVDYPWVSSATIFAQSPNEMRLEIQTGCTGDRVNPLFNTTFENTGGGTLTETMLYFMLPRAGVDGTTVDAVFADATTTLTPGVNAVIEYSTDAVHLDPTEVVGWTSVQPAPLSDIKWVRANVGNLDPITGEQLFTVVFTPGIDPASTEVARARTTMDSHELTVISTGLSVPFSLNGCPQLLTGTVFFDTDADGVLDAGEPLLDGWTVNLYQGQEVSTTPLTASSTDSSGVVDFWLNVGWYTLEVVVPGGTATLVVGNSPVSVEMAQNPVFVLFPVTCTCESDDNPCTDDQCSPDGTCTYVPDDTNACTIGNPVACMGNPFCQGGDCVTAPLNAGTDCGDCAVCDGTGGCTVMPESDSDCGVIDCDYLDTVCVDYQDVTAGGCVALFECPTAPEACTEFTQALPLNVAQDYNVFVFTHYTALMDVLGSIAAGTDIEGSGFDISRLDPDGWAIVAGGDVTLTNGSIWGDIWVGGHPELTNVDLQGSAFNSITMQAPIDFVAAQAALTDLSVQLSGVSPNGSTSEGTQVVFTGNSAVNVFAVTSDQLEGISDMVFDIPEGTTSIVNISGTDITMKQFEVFGVADPTRILFNAHEAGKVTVTSVEMVGSLLAPGATVVFEAGDWEGTIIATALEGYGEVHYFPFAGELPCDELAENLTNPLGAGNANKTPFVPTATGGCSANPSAPGTASGWGLALLGMALGILMLRRRVRS